MCLPRSGTLDRVQRGQGSQEAEVSTARDGEEEWALVEGEYWIGN